jgi:hypothetical protein
LTWFLKTIRLLYFYILTMKDNSEKNAGERQRKKEGRREK